MVTRVAWAQVEDVRLALIGMNTGAEPEASGIDLYGECEVGDAECSNRVRERAESEAQEEIDAEFGEVLEGGVAALESAL